jgi:hypothetical protein
MSAARATTSDHDADDTVGYHATVKGYSSASSCRSS